MPQQGAEKVEETNIQNKLISRETGLRFCGGSQELYEEILVSYCEEGRKYQKQLEQCLAGQDWGNYGVISHAIKSTSMNIGAVGLSELAKKMEFAAKAKNVEELLANHELLLELLEQVLVEAEGSHGAKEALPVLTVERGEYREKVEQLLEYVLNYEMTMALESLRALRAITAESDLGAEEVMERVEFAVNDFEYEEAERLLREFLVKF